MIEGSTMVLIYLFLGVPILIGLLGTWLTRPDKYYYKSTWGGRFKKVPFRSGRERKDR